MDLCTQVIYFLSKVASIVLYAVRVQSDHAGLFGEWNTSTDLSAYSVLAETEDDIVVCMGASEQDIVLLHGC